MNLEIGSMPVQLLNKNKSHYDLLIKNNFANLLALDKVHSKYSQMPTNERTKSKIVINSDEKQNRKKLFQNFRP